LSRKFPSLSNFYPKVGAPAFVTGPYGFSVRVPAQDDRSCAVAEEIYSYFSRREELRHQAVSDEAQHVVVHGESLWGIAKNAYGDGHYYVVLAEYNGREITERIKAGDIIKIPHAGADPRAGALHRVRERQPLGLAA
jgi:hypothetical protein